MKQDNLMWEWTKEGKLDILWILEDDNGVFYQKKKTINPNKESK